MEPKTRASRAGNQEIQNRMMNRPRPMPTRPSTRAVMPMPFRGCAGGTGYGRRGTTPAGDDEGGAHGSWSSGGLPEDEEPSEEVGVVMRIPSGNEALGPARVFSIL
ncbi:hypothetical protein HEK616_27350 [Streptomyces nigrescens]|uniref:Uncharacterized protein n=1 Tax=Streptomyces nigrescens TaxID=1920 RepID=A0ABM7ZS98_STRNI|nr:hypothetical protein HEK616_27350 [Streptomyces nigrescens]